MHTDTTLKEEPSESANNPAGHTRTRSNPADCAAMYYAGRWGLFHALPDLKAAHFLVQIGGG